MKHERHYEVKKLDEPIKEIWGNKVYNYVLTVTQDGVTKQDDWFKYETEEAAHKQCAELNEKLYISDFDEEEINEFYNSIDFTELYERTNKAIGLELTYNNKLEKGRGGYRIEIESNENIAEMSPIIKAAWRDFRVANFSSSICPNEETRNLKFWCTIQYSYEHQCGGHNGAEILSATYTPEKGWEIMTQVERQEYYKKLEEERYERYRTASQA